MLLTRIMLKTDNIKKYIAGKESTIKEVIKVIDNNKEGIAFIVDKNKKLLGTISDGDIRRFLFKNGNVNSQCSSVMNRSYIYLKKDLPEEATLLIQENRIRHIPLLDKSRKLIKVFVSDTIYDFRQEVIAVIMA